jgi:hypothetical protein
LQPTAYAWKPEEASPRQQAARREHIFALLREKLRARVVQHEGMTCIPYNEHPEDMRVHLWSARAFLHGSPDEQRLANALLASVEFRHADHFCGAASATLLVAEHARLEPQARDNLERFLQRSLSDWMTRDYAFHGANDNAPAGCVTALALYGQYVGNAGLLAFCRQRLAQLMHLLDLRGYIHECVSPTYSAISLMDFAELAEHAEHADIKAMALRAEQRIWQELLVHFHPRLRQLVGPFSRAYPDDNANQCTLAMMAIYAAFGDVSPVSPLRMLFPPADGTFAHGPWDFQLRSLAAQMAPTYHPPLELAAQAFQRAVPSTTQGSNEFCAGHGTPGGQTTVYCYMDETFGMGSFGSRTWIGQTTPLQLLYRRRAADVHASIETYLSSIRSVYTRMLVADKFESMEVRAASIEQEIGSDDGVAFSVQHQGTALLGYVPVRQRHDATRVIRTSLVWPFHHSRPDEVRYGDDALVGFSGSYRAWDWCFIRDGGIFLAVYPLIAQQQDAMLCSTQFADAGQYGLLSFFNMCGFHPCPLSDRELRGFGSGMLVHVAAAEQYESFERFIESMRQATIVQEQYGSERLLSYQHGDTQLELLYDLQQLNMRRAVRNGELVHENVWLDTMPTLPLVR